MSSLLKLEDREHEIYLNNERYKKKKSYDLDLQYTREEIQFWLHFEGGFKRRANGWVGGGREK